MRIFSRSERISRRRPKKVGAIAVEFLHALRQGHVQAAAEIGNLRLRRVVLGLGRLKRALDGGNLAAQCGDLLVEQIDLAHGPRADLPFRIKLAREVADLLVGAIRAARSLLQQRLQPRALAFGGGKRGL